MRCIPAIKKYFTCFSFNGRSSRSEIVWPFLFLFATGLILNFFLFRGIFSQLPPLEELKMMNEQQLYQMFESISQTKIITVYVPMLQLYSLYLFICSIFAFTRRLHDLDKSGYYYLWFIVPIVNFIFMIWLLCAKGTKGPNSYGPDPLESSSSDKSSQQA